jgi:hypothetical protein
MNRSGAKLAPVEFAAVIFGAYQEAELAAAETMTERTV